MKSFDLGGTGPALHFLHANGYPPDCYKPLFELLKANYRVFGMTLRPLWEDAKPDDINNWHPFSDDLIRFLSDRGSGPVIGVGHSIGATVTLRSALQHPNEFRALILLDPVLFIPRSMMIWKIIRTLGLGERVHPLIVGAKKRRRTFDDLDTLFRGYRKRHIFRYMSDENLRAFIEGITTSAANGGYELVYPPEWEAQIYRTNMHDADIWKNLHTLKIPTLIIRGSETNTFLESAAKLIQWKHPEIRVEALEKSTHLLPLERPQEVFDSMRSFLKEVL
jgi:pimeloyl-ACP methyl ester carboxylesterase